jgi:peptidoglycan-associated lipoprotein
MHFSRLVLPIVLATLAGCSSTKVAEPAAPVSTTPAVGAQIATPAVPSQTAQTAVKTVTLHPLDDPKSSLAKRSVYFDFDSFVIHDAERPLLESHAKYLTSSRTAKIRIEGNSDARGGSEYNLALGQKRAEAVLKSLQLLGVPAGEMEAVSFGKEKPADPGHDETAWAKNRRADLNYIRR